MQDASLNVATHEDACSHDYFQQKNVFSDILDTYEVPQSESTINNKVISANSEKRMPTAQVTVSTTVRLGAISKDVQSKCYSCLHSNSSKECC